VGTAHKIEIDPAVLDFGIVFVGSTAERKLTVKNQGVTTVTLEVPNTTKNTASPFRIMVESMSGSPLVLGSGKSTGVPVQFSATTSGQFTGTARLIINNSFNLEVPLTARAVTFEEFLQLFGTLFVPGTPNLFFDGFEGLNISLADFQRLAQELLTRQLQPATPTPQDLEIAQALEELKVWLDTLEFEQKVQELMQRYPAFGTFVSQIQNQILNLGIASKLTYVQVLDTLTRFLSQSQPDLLQNQPLLFILEQDVKLEILLYTTILYIRVRGHPEFSQLVLTLNLGTGGIPLDLPLPEGFRLAVFYIQSQLEKYCGTSCLYDLARRLRSVAFILNPDAFYSNFKGLLMEITTAAMVAWNGWWLLGFSVDVKTTEIDIIARTSIPGIGVVIAFIEVKSDKRLNAKQIAEKLSLYSNYIENTGKDQYPYWGNFHVAVLISYEAISSTTVQTALNNYQGTTPALVIHCVANCNGYGIGIFNIQFKNMTPEQAVAIAAALGFQFYSGPVPSEVDDPDQNHYYFTGDPTFVMLLLMAWTMR
jgi:hypothetical protein